ncbi:MULTISPECIES: glycoside hydrolase family 5 protein [unclassified Nocardia]|uniref:glycoside hydrolase family 5 protein n=1 Tax=unclassified Nocardia TaxID=2637762 RepID=UPI001CE429F3|nr:MULTISPECIES: glycoside hydrolase family 5 protein [unclassified Nocardia]
MTEIALDRDIPPGIRLGVVRGITYGLLRPPELIMPAVRSVGAGMLRCFLYWSQIEPEPGRFVWDAVDALLAQLDGDEEVLITVSSASLWGTRRVTDMLPPSPAKDLDTFGAFVRALVTRCRGRITYWQFDNEPSMPILWAGTPAEYLEQLKVFAAAVRAADPEALVMLGGEPHENKIRPDTFEYLVEHGRDHFDVYDVHLYEDPYQIPDRIAATRAMMARHGYQKPIVAAEYNGPLPGPQAWRHLAAAAPGFMAMMSENSDWTATTTDDKPAAEHDAMVELYNRMPELPPELQMFMQGCPPEYADMHDRWMCREIVMRNLLALSAGVRRTTCWNLAPETPGGQKPYTILGLLFDKFALMDYDEDEITLRHRQADALALTSRMLHGAKTIQRMPTENPDSYIFEVDRDGGPLVVAWQRHADLGDESAPATAHELPWPTATARALNAYGEPVPIRVTDGRATLPLTLTPIFVES